MPLKFSCLDALTDGIFFANAMGIEWVLNGY